MPGGREFDKVWDFVKNESETSKHCLDQIFTGENKEQVEFLTIFKAYMFSQWNFASSIGQFFNSAVTYTLQKSEELPLACLFEVFAGLWLSTPTSCMKDYDYVKRFVRVLVSLEINTGCLKKLLKHGEHHIAYFQFKLC